MSTKTETYQIFCSRSQVKEVMAGINDRKDQFGEFCEFEHLEINDWGVSFCVELGPQNTDVVNAIAELSADLSLYIHLALRNWGCPAVVYNSLIYKGDQITYWECGDAEILGFEDDTKEIELLQSSIKSHLDAKRVDLERRWTAEREEKKRAKNSDTENRIDNSYNKGVVEDIPF